MVVWTTPLSFACLSIISSTAFAMLSSEASMDARFSWAMSIAWILLFSTGKVDSETLTNSALSRGIPSDLQISSSENTVADMSSTVSAESKSCEVYAATSSGWNTTSSTKVDPPPYASMAVVVLMPLTIQFSGEAFSESMNASRDSSMLLHAMSLSCIVRSPSWASRNPLSDSLAVTSDLSQSSAWPSIPSSYATAKSFPSPDGYWRIAEAFRVNEAEPTSCLSRSWASSHTRSFLFLTSSVYRSSLKKKA